jgi:hypothetical protein
MDYNKNKPKSTLIERYGTLAASVATVGALAVGGYVAYEKTHDAVSQVQHYKPGENPFEQQQQH